MIDQNKVYYLVYSYIKQGYVFPSELIEDEWSCNGLGIFALFNNDGNDQALDHLHILAIDQGEEKTFNLIRECKEPIYKVVVNNNSDNNNINEELYFRILWHNKLRYVGREDIERFAVIIPTDIVRLEELCLEQKFFFVGYDLG